jgi:hypothetical protein
VISSRNAVSSRLTTWNRTDFSFLMRWASSMTTYCHFTGRKTPFSLMTISKDVTHTSNAPLASRVAFCSARAALSPWNLTARMTGHHFLNSLIQLCSVDLGTITRCGPVMPRNSCR